MFLFVCLQTDWNMLLDMQGGVCTHAWCYHVSDDAAEPLEQLLRCAHRCRYHRINIALEMMCL